MPASESESVSASVSVSPLPDELLPEHAGSSAAATIHAQNAFFVLDFPMWGQCTTSRAGSEERGVYGRGLGAM